MWALPRRLPGRDWQHRVQPGVLRETSDRTIRNARRVGGGDVPGHCVLHLPARLQHARWHCLLHKGKTGASGCDLMFSQSCLDAASIVILGFVSARRDWVDLGRQRFHGVLTLALRVVMLPPPPGCRYVARMGVLRPSTLRATSSARIWMLVPATHATRDTLAGTSSLPPPVSLAVATAGLRQDVLVRHIRTRQMQANL